MVAVVYSRFLPDCQIQPVELSQFFARIRSLARLDSSFENSIFCLHISADRRRNAKPTSLPNELRPVAVALGKAERPESESEEASCCRHLARFLLARLPRLPDSSGRASKRANKSQRAGEQIVRDRLDGPKR